jgi:hypothetical protein
MVISVSPTLCSTLEMGLACGKSCAKAKKVAKKDINVNRYFIVVYWFGYKIDVYITKNSTLLLFILGESL